MPGKDRTLFFKVPCRCSVKALSQPYSSLQCQALHDIKLQQDVRVLRFVVGRLESTAEADSRTNTSESLQSITMGKSAKERKDAKFKLKQPDRSGPDPSKQTLLDLAEQRGLFNTQPGEKVGDEETGEAELVAGRIIESILWSLSLTMLHFTLDVLVSHQYAMEIEWPSIMMRAAQAYPSTSLSIFSFQYLLTDI